MGSEIVQDHNSGSSPSIVVSDRLQQQQSHYNKHEDDIEQHQQQYVVDADSIDTNLHNPKQRRRLLVRDLNECLTCSLCEGYLIDATVITICLHTFCRSCIVRYLESSRYCPTCEIQVHKSKPLSALRTDKSLQLLIYKLIPSVYQNEVKRRSEFYLQARASSSCSEDSILTDSEQHEQSVLSHINENDDIEFFSPDDSISLSLEYYQDNDDVEEDDNNSRRVSDIQDAALLAVTTTNSDENTTVVPTTTANNINNTNEISSPLQTDLDNSSSTSLLNQSNNGDISDNKTINNNTDNYHENNNAVHKRYLQCPAGVNVKHLTKFIRMKYGLSYQHRVDIIYEDEILPKHFTLMDVAYTFNWRRTSPMRFMYRIFESTKSPIFRPVYRQQDVKVSEPRIPSSLPSPASNITEESQTSVQKTTNNRSSEKANDSGKKSSSFTESILRKELTKPLRRGSDERKSEKSEGKTKKHKKQQQQQQPEEQTVVDQVEKKKPNKEHQTTILDEREDENNLEQEEEEEDISEKEREILEFAKKRDLEWANLIRQSRDENGEEENEEEQQRREEPADEELEEQEDEVVEEVKKKRTSDSFKSKENKESSQEKNKKKQKFEEKILPTIIRDVRVSLENKDYYDRSVPKKRKKSKHSKHFANYSKRRKIHAEIQNHSNSNEKDDILKLKVKLTPSIHKVHKHKHSNSEFTNSSSKTSLPEKTSRNNNVHVQIKVNEEETKNHKTSLSTPSVNIPNSNYSTTANLTTSINTRTSSTQSTNVNTTSVTTCSTISDMTAKERLLQMRQVRHKHIQQEKLKTQADASSTSVSNSATITNNSHLPPPQKKVRFNDEPILTSPTHSPAVTITPATTASNNQITVPAIKSPTHISPPATSSFKTNLNDDARKVNKCVPNLVAPKSFTVSKVDMNSLQEKRKEPEDEIDPKVPSLEIMLINPPTQTNANSDLSRANNSITTTASANATTKNIYQNNKQGGMQIKPFNNNNKFAKLSLMQSKVLMMKNLNLTQINNKNNSMNMTNKTSIVAKSSSGMEVTKTAPAPSSTARPSPTASSNSSGAVTTPTTNNSISSKLVANSTKMSQQQRPTPATIPLSRIKKLSQNNFTSATSTVTPPPNGKIPQKVDNFGALDLSRKSPDNNQTEISSKQKSIDDTTNPNENKTNVKIEVQKIVQNNHNLSNLHILSESAVHIRDLMVSAQNKNMTSTASQTIIKQKLKDTTQKLVNQTTNTSSKTPIVLPQSKQTALVNKLLNSNKNNIESSVATKIPPTTSNTTNNVRIANKLSQPIANDETTPTVTINNQQKKSTLTNATHNIENKTAKISIQDLKSSPEQSNGIATSGAVTLSSHPTTPSSETTGKNNGLATTPTASTYPMLQQTLRIPVLQNSKSLQQQMRNLQKMPKQEPKLNHQFSAQQVRATPNQTVRNIPNPSALLARHAQAAAVAQSQQTNPTTTVPNTTTTTQQQPSSTPATIASSTTAAATTTPTTTSNATLAAINTGTTAPSIQSAATINTEANTSTTSSTSSSNGCKSSALSSSTSPSTSPSSTSTATSSSSSDSNNTTVATTTTAATKTTLNHLNQINNSTVKAVSDEHNNSKTCSHSSSNDK